MKRLPALIIIALSCVLIFSVTANAQRSFKTEETLARELKTLGIFNGVSATDFDLDRAPSRIEAVVMLVRVLGKEAEALSGTYTYPFTDIPDWADKYIGYAYTNGLANGQALTKFGTGEANAAMYLTFVLRSLGYSDTNGRDFVWDNPFQLARETGILPDGVDLELFLRADIVLVSHAALSSYLKGTTNTLSEKLISAGVFSRESFDSTYNASALKELSAEETYAKCSPAVFYIEIYDKKGTAIASGRGFFIDSNGTAVTNFHVIGEAHSAKIQVSDTGEFYSVTGVWDYSIANDWAVIQTDCKSSNYLSVADPSTVVGASTVYAIGSPLGLQNTISQGIISNPARVDGETTYIQTSAAISSGSSGGALINKYGQVIGITSAGYAEGQNLNLALPMTYLTDFTKEETVSHDILSEVVSYLSAYYALEAFTLEYAQEYDEDLGHNFYKVTQRQGTYVEYNLYYKEDNDYTDVYVYYESRNSHAFHYFFDISSNSTETLTYYVYQAYENGEFKTVSKGEAKFDASEYSASFEYPFYEHSCPERLDYDSVCATELHDYGLSFIQYVFQTYFSNAYSVEDLGYTSI